MGELSSPIRLGIHHVLILSNCRGGSGYDRLTELFRLAIEVRELMAMPSRVI